LYLIHEFMIEPAYSNFLTHAHTCTYIHGGRCSEQPPRPL
jgi:hypothetical protein